MSRRFVFPLAALCSVVLPIIVVPSASSFLETPAMTSAVPPLESSDSSVASPNVSASARSLESMPQSAKRHVTSIGPLVASVQQQPVRYRDIVFERLQRTNDIVYGSATDIPTGNMVQLSLDLYEPAGDTEQSRPVLLFIHGGGFVAGDKSAGQRWANEFARRGWVVVSIEYRLAQGDLATVGIPAAVSDARQAVRWLWNASPQYRLDLGRLVVGGSSAGAITSLFLTYTEMEKQPADEMCAVAGVMDLWGGLYGMESEMTAGEPPLIIVHGTDDQVVPYELAEALRDRAAEVDIPYDFRPLEGVGHGSSETAMIAEWTANFFYPLLWPNTNLPTDTPQLPTTAVPSATSTVGTGSPTAVTPEPTAATATSAAPTVVSSQFEACLPYVASRSSTR